MQCGLEAYPGGGSVDVVVQHVMDKARVPELSPGFVITTGLSSGTLAWREGLLKNAQAA